MCVLRVLAYIYVCLCVFPCVEINNNKHVYRQSQVRKPTGSEVDWAECLLTIGTGCRVQVFAWSSIAQSVCQQAFRLLANRCLRPWVRILHSAEEDNLSPFDSNITSLCQSIEINNNKHVCIRVCLFVCMYTHTCLCVIHCHTYEDRIPLRFEYFSAFNPLMTRTMNENDLTLNYSCRSNIGFWDGFTNSIFRPLVSLLKFVRISPVPEQHTGRKNIAPYDTTWMWTRQRHIPVFCVRGFQTRTLADPYWCNIWPLAWGPPT